MSVLKQICSWIDRMSMRYGGYVIDKETGKKLDWGQALARERYGKDWHLLHLDEVSKEDLDRALRWEKGDWPDWAEPVWK